MHKLFQKQLEEALQHIGDEFTTNNHNTYTSTSTSTNNSHSHLNTTRHDHRKRSKSVVESDVLDVTSSLNALDALHDKLKVYSYENRKLKMQLTENRNGTRFKELDYENFILRKENEELMERMEELERSLRAQNESNREYEVSNKDVQSEEESGLKSTLMRDEDSQESSSDEHTDDLFILVAHEKQQSAGNSVDISIQCQLSSRGLIEQKDVDTNTTNDESFETKQVSEMKEGDMNIGQLNLEEHSITSSEESPLIPTIEISLGSITPQSEYYVERIEKLNEQVELLKKELELKNDSISELTREKEQFARNELEHQQVLSQLTAHVKELVRESILLRKEYNSSISKLKEECISSKPEVRIDKP